MARRRYVVAYDIADPKRLRRICGIMESFGQRLQYSVFVCDLSRAELTRLQEQVLDVMRLGEDSVMQVDLGPTSACADIRFIGRHRPLPDSGPMVV